MATIALNARFYSHVPTGMQRYGIEMATRLSDLLEVVRPASPLRGAQGHLWEQVYLPTASGNRLLWSPNNTGPLAVARQICTMHDIIPVEHPEWFNARFAAWYRWLLPRLTNRVRHLIAVSQFTKDRLVERFGVHPDKISVIWNGVDAQFRPRSPQEIAAVRAALGIRSPRYLLSLGSLEPRKNLRRLLTAWSRLKRELPDDLGLVIVGSKGHSLVFQDAGVTETPEGVQFTGYAQQEDLPALYSGAMALVYPSLYEGFGLPPLEAMACGTPVITSNTTSLPEISGGAALLVDPLNVDAIADAILRIVRDQELHTALRHKSLAHAANLTWDESAIQTRKILEERRNG
jgi:glycosyltransferase involved in cell wall biosynthesis